MNILAFDTASDILAAAWRGTSGAFAFAGKPDRRHAEALMAALDACLTASGAATGDIDLVACALGPGSFTGLRIGMATAKGLALALGIPWVAIPSLDCIAWGHKDFPGPVIPVLDGRKGRVYAALYRAGIRNSPWMDIAPDDLVKQAQAFPDVLFAGPDASLFEEYSLERTGFAIAQDDPRARALAMAALAEGEFAAHGSAPDELGPLYLREPDIGQAATH